MNWIIDLILVAIIIVSAVFAAKKGFIGTLFSLLGTVIAIVLSVMLSAPVSGFIDSQFVNPYVKKYVLSAIDSSAAGKTYDEALNSIDISSKIENMPQSLRKILEMADIDVDEIVNKAESATENTQKVKDNLIDSIASPISGTISRVIALILLFAVLSIALWVVSRLITAVFNVIPLGKSLNKAGGLIFGIIRGLIIVFAVSVLFSALSKGIDPDSSSIFSEKTINSTFVLKTVAGFNPINSILNIK